MLRNERLIFEGNWPDVPSRFRDLFMGDTPDAVWIGVDYGSEESMTGYGSYIKGRFIYHDAIPMTKAEIVSRRYEAMRMRWPEKTMCFVQQEMLILMTPLILSGAMAMPVLGDVLNKKFHEFIVSS